MVALALVAVACSPDVAPAPPVTPASDDQSTGQPADGPTGEPIAFSVLAAGELRDVVGTRNVRVASVPGDIALQPPVRTRHGVIVAVGPAPSPTLSSELWLMTPTETVRLAQLSLGFAVVDGGDTLVYSRRVDAANPLSDVEVVWAELPTGLVIATSAPLEAGGGVIGTVSGGVLVYMPDQALVYPTTPGAPRPIPLPRDVFAHASAGDRLIVIEDGLCWGVTTFDSSDEAATDQCSLVGTVAFSPDGAQMAGAAIRDDASTSVFFQSLDRPERIDHVELPGAYDVAWLDDGSVLALTDVDRRVRVHRCSVNDGCHLATTVSFTGGGSAFLHPVSLVQELE